MLREMSSKWGTGKVVLALAAACCCGLAWLISVEYVDSSRYGINYAARAGDPRRVGELLDQDATTIEHRDRSGMTPLLGATLKGRTETVALLVSRGADVNATWDYVETGNGSRNALHVAAIYGETGAALVLLKAGTRVNQLSLQSETPLDIAVRNDRGPLVALLRAHGGVSGKATPPAPAPR